MRHSETRVHCSPPSIAALHAAEHALTLNRTRGDAIRLHLAELAIRFRKQIEGMGISVSRSLFPVRALALDPHFRAVRLHCMLREAGVQTLLARNRKPPGAKLLFVFDASHSIDHVDQAAMLLDAAIRVQFARAGAFAI